MSALTWVGLAHCAATVLPFWGWVTSWTAGFACHCAILAKYLFLLYSTVHKYPSSSALGASVWEKMCVRGMILSILYTQSGLIWKTSWLSFPRLFWEEGGGRTYHLNWVTGICLWLLMILCHWKRKLRLLIFSVEANFSIFGFPLPCTTFSSYG